MDRETVRQEIKRQISCEEFLKRSPKAGAHMYVCPNCNSGEGPHKTGALKFYPDSGRWYCHACNTGGDVIDLYRMTHNVDYNEALEQMAREIGIDYTLDRDTPGPGPAATPQTAPGPEGSPGRRNPDYTAYYRQCAARLQSDPAAGEYLRGRGISLETAAAYGIGYDPAADLACAPGAMNDAGKKYPRPRIIIPTAAGYVGRAIDGAPGPYEKMNSKGSAPAIFNAGVLNAQDVREIFVTEGAFDALSVLEAGAAAIALNSAGNAGALIKRLEEHPTAATLILCLDNDKKGKEATETIKAGLRRLNISFIKADICAGYKDPNEALVADRERFFTAVALACRQTAAKPDNTAYYIDSLMTDDIARFKRDKKTGFKNLDEQAGGLYPGLYVLAAISSLGKTSFALQLADQLAAAGEEIIFFSLEQSRLELVSKSLARITAQVGGAATVADGATTSLAIRKGHLSRRVLEAKEEYKEIVADRISIVEGNFSCDISFIGDYIRQYIRRNDTRPVVFIDYLQILQPADNGNRRQTVKETVDSTVTELKRISRELDLTVIVISSVNRANYLTPIDFESLKESGGIEYTADVIWGMQLKCLEDELFDGPANNRIKERREAIKLAKAATPRQIALVCLKNRYGIANYTCGFDYYPACDLFIENAKCSFNDGLDVDAIMRNAAKKAGRKLPMNG